MEHQAVITSPRNPLIKHVRTLLRREGRTDLLAVEGLRAIITATQAGHVVEQMLVAPERLHSGLAQAALDQASAQGATILPVAPALLDTISARDASQGMIAIIRRPDTSLARLMPETTHLIAMLFAPQDPGNVGTIARTAESAGATALMILGQSGVDPFHPRAVRASMGTLFALNVIEMPDALAAIAHLHQCGIAVIGAEGTAPTDLWSVPLTRSTAILLGNERTGLSADLLARCDHVARIPLFGQADSLNVAAAAAIFLFEAVRQRITDTPHPFGSS